MALSKSLLAALVVLLVAGGGVAATDVAQTDTDASTTTVSALDMGATLENETVTVHVMDGSEPVENASITVEGDEDVTVVTDANGAATVNVSNVTEDGASLDELDVEYDSATVEGELEFVVQDDSLTLVEETYEYDVADESADHNRHDIDDDERHEHEDAHDDEDEHEDHERDHGDHEHDDGHEDAYDGHDDAAVE